MQRARASCCARRSAPRSRNATAPPELAAAAVSLWFGPHAHLVHYPIRSGGLINVVAIIRDDWHASGWSTAGAREEILARFPATSWPPAARAMLAAAPAWQKWAL